MKDKQLSESAFAEREREDLKLFAISIYPCLQVNTKTERNT
jgi:hypothetical protein